MYESGRLYMEQPLGLQENIDTSFSLMSSLPNHVKGSLPLPADFGTNYPLTNCCVVFLVSGHNHGREIK